MSRNAQSSLRAPAKNGFAACAGALVVLGLAGVASAADGQLDTSFSGDGKVITSVAPASNGASAVALQADGKVVVAGTAYVGGHGDFAVVRYRPDGGMDSTFSGDGKAIVSIGSSDDRANALAIQPDGKIVVAGNSYDGVNENVALARLNPDGSLDSAFDSDGKVVTPMGTSHSRANALAIQGDGKVVVAGAATEGTNYDFALARFNPNGSLDTGFDSDGKVTTAIGIWWDEAFDLALQSNGRIVVVGQADVGSYPDFALARFMSDGSLDPSFDTDGKVTTAFGSGWDAADALVLQADGRIVAAGSAEVPATTFALARFMSDGSLDPSFDTDGKVTTAFGGSTAKARALAMQGDRIIAAGESSLSSELKSDFALARYNSDGSLDVGFDTDGRATTDFTWDDLATGVAIQSDGKILAAGMTWDGDGPTDFAMLRYNVGQSNTAVSIKAPSKVRAGSQVTISGTLSSSDAACAGAQQVTLKKGSATLATSLTGATGAYKFSLKIKRKTSVQVNFAGSSVCNPSASLKKVIKVV